MRILEIKVLDRVCWSRNQAAVGDVARRDGLLRARAHAEAVRSAREDALPLRALHFQRRRDARFVAHLDEERAPSVLHELRLRGAGGHLDAALGIDVDVEQRVRDRGPSASRRSRPHARLRGRARRAPAPYPLRALPASSA